MTNQVRCGADTGDDWRRALGTQVKPRGPSPYLFELLEQVDPRADAAPWIGDAPDDDATNPAIDAVVPGRFPGELDQARLQRRRLAAEAVDTAIAALGAAPAGDPEADQQAAEAVLAETGIDLRAVDTEITQLVAEAEAAGRGVIEVDLPPTLTATSVRRLESDPDAFARDLARPLPRKPSSPARFGTRFHTWVQSHVGQQSRLDPTDLPGRADTARRRVVVHDAAGRPGGGEAHRRRLPAGLDRGARSLSRGGRRGVPPPSQRSGG